MSILQKIGNEDKERAKKTVKESRKSKKGTPLSPRIKELSETEAKARLSPQEGGKTEEGLP